MWIMNVERSCLIFIFFFPAFQDTEQSALVFVDGGGSGSTDKQTKSGTVPQLLLHEWEFNILCY